MTFKFTPLVASFCAALSLVNPRPANASAPAGEAPPASSDPETKVKIGLVVDTSEIDEEYRKQLELTTIRQLRPALEAAGYEVTDGFVELAVRVRFAPIKHGQFRDHGIHFEFIKGNETERAIEWVLCNACGLVPLEEALDKAGPQLIDAVNEKVTEEQDGPENGGHGDTGDGDTGDGDGDSQPIELPKPIGPLGISGSVMMGLGLGTLIGGIVEITRGEVRNDDPTMLDSTLRDHFVPSKRQLVVTRRATFTYQYVRNAPRVARLRQVGGNRR